jgi:hypothetical protein
LLTRILIVEPEPSDSSSNFGDEVPKIIEVPSDSDVEKFVEFEPVMEVEPVLDTVGPWKVEFVDPEADKPTKE